MNYPVYKLTDRDTGIPSIVYYLGKTTLEDGSAAFRFCLPEGIESGIMVLSKDDMKYFTMEKLKAVPHDY